MNYLSKEDPPDALPDIAEMAQQGEMVAAPHLSGIERLSSAEYYPVSHAQRRLWLLQQLMPQSCFYTMSEILELEGPLNISALKEAFQTIVDRHASLRTTFTVIDGKPIQRVTRELRLQCPFRDLSALDAETQMLTISQLIESENTIVFDLESGPLFRIQLVMLEVEHHILLLNMHHIISDAKSWQVLEQEFAALYRAFCHQLPNPLPSLSIQYMDYAHWQNQRLAAGHLEEHENYWIKQFADPAPLLDLPLDHVRQHTQACEAYAGQQLGFDPNLVARVHKLCQQNNTTLFTVLLTAVGVLLSQLSDQEDFVIGAPVADRDQEELEGLIGLFVNMLPLRLDTSGTPTFLELLERVNKIVFDAYAHQECPFDYLVDKLHPARDLSRSPIFSVMFQVNEASHDILVENLSIHPYPMQTAHASLDLSISFTEVENGLDCYLEYSTDLFDADTIARIMGHFQTLLEEIVADPEQPITLLPLLTEAERYQLLVEWNETLRDYSQNRGICQLFEFQVERTPEAVAVMCGDERMTYQELNGRANQLAHLLRKRDVGPEVLVGICMKRSIEMVVALLSVLKVGGAYVPLDPSYPQDRLAFMLQDSQVGVLLTQELLREALPAHPATLVCLDAHWKTIAQECDQNLLSEATSENLAYVIYTSGSTGRPKGVMITRRSVTAFIHWAISVFTPQDLTGVLASTSICFDLSVFELFVPLSSGGTVILAENVLHLSDVSARAQVTLLNTVPSAMAELVRSGSLPASVRTVNLAGEALHNALVQQLYQQDTIQQVFNLYGPSEDTTYSTYVLVEQRTEREPSIGRPIANTQVYILDRYLQPVPVGVPGELYLGGEGLARGYLNRPELTSERFLPHPFSHTPGARLYRTGDLVRYLPGGTIEFLGRLDHQVKVRGFRIELGEIEAALEQHPHLREAVVVVREDVVGDKRLVAYLVPIRGQIPSIGELQSYLKERLPAYMVPSAFVPLDALPLTHNGKVDRRHLPAPDGSRGNLGASYVAPRNPTEAEMLRLWENVLRVQPIGIFDDFFALGGHSLTAVELMGAIRERFAVDLPLVALFRTPTIASVCEHLRTGTIPSSRCLFPLQEGNTHPPLFFIHPQGGGVLCYRLLTSTLGKETAVYGLQAIGYDSEATPLWTIEEMAERYVEEIQRVSPHGPYRIAGWSFGGNVAFEIVRRLEALGEPIDFLGLLNAYAPEQESELNVENQHQRAAERALVNLATLHLKMDKSAFEGLDEEQALTLAFERAKELRLLPQTAVIETVRRQVKIMMINQYALDAYRDSGTIQSDIHLFRACEDNRENPRSLVDPQKWHKYTTGKMHVIPVSGNHHNLVNPPSVFALGKAIRAVLAKDTSLG